MTTIGAAPAGYPGDHLNYVYSKLVVAARAAGIQAIDGPYAAVGDEDGLRERALLARALGLDGKWTIHPAQIAVVNAVFTPGREEWERAEAMLAAYERAAPDEGRGAAMFEGEMIDEANRKMAARLARGPRGAATPALTPAHRERAERRAAHDAAQTGAESSERSACVAERCSSHARWPASRSRSAITRCSTAATCTAHPDAARRSHSRASRTKANGS